MSRKRGVNTTYIYAWPAENIVKVGVSAHRRWLSFRGGVLIGYHEGNDAYQVEEAWGEILERAGQSAFRDRDEAVKYLGGHGGGWAECFRLPSGTDAASMLSAFPGAFPAAMHVTVRTERTDADPPRPGENLTFLNAHDDGAAPRQIPKSRCDEHGVTLPCSGCRADELAAPKLAGAQTTDARMRAAGDDETRIVEG